MKSLLLKMNDKPLQGVFSFTPPSGASAGTFMKRLRGPAFCFGCLTH